LDVARTKKKVDLDIDKGRWIMMPHAVMTSRRYIGLSHPARSLLWEFAVQLGGHNNGWLIATDRKLKERGWNSSGTISRAKRELLDAEFIFETVKGHRPNKASWYAVTWRALDAAPYGKSYDPGADRLFFRSAYAKGDPLPIRPTRQQLYARHASATENAVLTPSAAARAGAITPCAGAGDPLATPLEGAVLTGLGPVTAP
jgi:hypothetical protein